ncbi:MAG: TetR/AcrR family transcriptional regulator [Bacillota bacterium]
MDREHHKRSSIFDAAMAVFSEKGFEKATVDEIAERAGIAKGTIYNNYGSKKNLFLSLIEEGIERLETAVKKEIARRNNILTQLEAVITVQLQFFEEYKNYCKVLLSEVWGQDTRWKEKAERIRSGYLSIIRDLIEAGKSQGLINEALHTGTTASALFGMVGIAALDRFLFEKEYSYEDILNTLKSLFFTGIEAKAT